MQYGRSTPRACCKTAAWPNGRATVGNSSSANAQAQPARGPCETPAHQPASEHGDAADQHAEASQVLESMQHGQDIEAQLDEVMQDADDADVAVQFADADNPEQHADMCQPACSEAFGQAATGHEHQLGQDVPDSQQQTGGAGTSGRPNAASLQPPLRGLHLTAMCTTSLPQRSLRCRRTHLMRQGS